MTPAYRANYAEIDWSNTPDLPRAQIAVVQRSALPCPHIASDCIPGGVQSQVTGRWHDSKSALRREYKAHNVIEVGNDPARLRPRVKSKPDERVVVNAIDKAEARFNRGERVFKK